MIICIPTSIVGTLVSALAAFAFSKLKYKSKNFLFTTLLVTMMIPGTISMIPSYILFDQINWVDSFLPLIVPAMLGSASCVFFMRQFFFSIPNELMECSQIDGLGNFGIFLRVILPLSVPALIAQFLLSFVGTYNAYLSPLIYLQSPDNYTLQIALNFFRGTYQTDWAVVMAGAAVSLLPTMILFLFGQKYFIDGIATTGLKM
jgi:multiple sugar transport system permease protein